MKKFDFSVTKQTLNPKKVYAVDQGFIHRIGFSVSADKGRILENIVFLELLRRKKEIYYYSGRNECDFLIKKGVEITDAIQVTYNLDKENFEWEINGLKEAVEKYHLKKGVLIYYDMELPVIELPFWTSAVPVWKWLLTGEEDE